MGGTEKHLHQEFSQLRHADHTVGQPVSGSLISQGGCSAWHSYRLRNLLKEKEKKELRREIPHNNCFLGVIIFSI